MVSKEYILRLGELEDELHRSVSILNENHILMLNQSLVSPVSEFSLFDDGNKGASHYIVFEFLLRLLISDFIREAILFLALEKNIICHFRNDGTVKETFSDLDGSIYSNIPFQFIFETDAGVVGFRFTEFKEKAPITHLDITRLMTEFHLDTIVIIDWTEKKEIQNCELITPKIIRMTGKEFFSKYFNEEQYEELKKHLINGITYSREKYEYRLVKQFSHGNIYELVEESLETLRNAPYTYYRSVHNTIWDNTDPIYLPEKDLEIISNSYTSTQLYEVMTGLDTFAISFLTSEYLLNTFNHNDLFDYTSVISGYLKSIEQLLKEIVLKNYLGNKNLGISRNYKNKDKHIEPLFVRGKKKKIEYIPLVVDNIDDFDLSLGSLMHFFKQNKRNHVLKISSEGYQCFFECLDRFRNECRNEHFHTDNLRNWNSTQNIRKNTLFLYFMILGSIKVNGDLLKLKHNLGLVNMKNRTLIRELDALPFDKRKFIFKFENEKEMLVFRVRPRIYIGKGRKEFGRELQLRFVPVKSFDIIDQMTDEEFEIFQEQSGIIIHEDYLPEKIWIVNEDYRTLIFDNNQ